MSISAAESAASLTGATQALGALPVRPVGETPSPYLHVGPDRIYNPLSDRTLAVGDDDYEVLRELLENRPPGAEASARLREAGWLVSAGDDLSSRFYLKHVSLEAHTVCNQACYFCPVSVAPREDYFMPTELYQRIVGELAAFRSTIEAVFMISYNEPTADARFLEQVRTIKAAGLPPAVLTNATGLTPNRVDALVEMGGLRFLSVNLSTLDRERYARERGGDHLELVLRNMDYAKDRAVADQMDLAVLGTGDESHRHDFEQITTRFAGSRFAVKYYEVMDRAAYLQIGAKPPTPLTRLAGCNNVGSRPLQHLHITPRGQCVLCCEDYDEKYVVGDLTQQSLLEVLTGPQLALMRRWIYGVEEAPANFICRNCTFALSR